MEEVETTNIFVPQNDQIRVTLRLLLVISGCFSFFLSLFFVFELASDYRDGFGGFDKPLGLVPSIDLNFPRTNSSFMIAISLFLKNGIIIEHKESRGGHLTYDPKLYNLKSWKIEITWSKYISFSLLDPPMIQIRCGDLLLKKRFDVDGVGELTLNLIDLYEKRFEGFYERLTSKPEFAGLYVLPGRMIQSNQKTVQILSKDFCFIILLLLNSLIVFHLIFLN